MLVEDTAVTLGICKASRQMDQTKLSSFSGHIFIRAASKKLLQYKRN